jgi:hypothetical protein
MSKIIHRIFCGKVRDINEKDHSGEVVMSNEALDRYDEIIEVDAYTPKVLKNFMKHPVLLSSHRYSGDLRSQLGEWTKVFKDGKELIGCPKYYVDEGNPEADWAWNLFSKGIAAFSVGVIPKTVETLDYDKWRELKDKGKRVARRIYKELDDLIETSQCLIPANQEALQRSMEEGKTDDEKDIAQFYFSNLDKIEGLGVKAIVESDIAEKFLIKIPETVEDKTVEEKKVESKESIAEFVELELVEDKRLDEVLAILSEIKTFIVDIREWQKENNLKEFKQEIEIKSIVPTVVDETYIDKLLQTSEEERSTEKVDNKSMEELSKALKSMTDLLKAK